LKKVYVSSDANMLTMVNPLLLRRFIASQNIKPLDKASSLVSISPNNHFEFFLNAANDGLFQTNL
jgi:hypothetical protein